jgi:hypothetical protein
MATTWAIFLNMGSIFLQDHLVTVMETHKSRRAGTTPPKLSIINVNFVKIFGENSLKLFAQVVVGSSIHQ